MPPKYQPRFQMRVSLVVRDPVRAGIVGTKQATVLRIDERKHAIRLARRDRQADAARRMRADAVPVISVQLRPSSIDL